MVEPTRCRRTPGTGIVPYTLLLVTETRLLNGTLEVLRETTDIVGSFSDCCYQTRQNQLPKGQSWSVVTVASLTNPAP